MKTRKKISERLYDRLIGLGYLTISHPRRTYRGKIDIRLGLWSWYCELSSGIRIGSRDTMTACVNADHLVADKYPWIDTNINAVNEAED